MTYTYCLPEHLSTGEVSEFTGLTKRNLDQLEYADNMISIPRRGKLKYYPLDMIIWLKLYKMARDIFSYQKTISLLPPHSLMKDEILTRKYLFVDVDGDTCNYQLVDIIDRHPFILGLIEENKKDSSIFCSYYVLNNRDNKFVLGVLLGKFRERIIGELLEFTDKPILQNRIDDYPDDILVG